MFESFALLYVSNAFFPDEKQYRISKYLVDQLHSLNFVVEKISFVKEDKNIVKHELNMLAKEYDFVIIICADLKTKVIFKVLDDICNEKSVEKSQFTNNFSNHVQEQYDEKESISLRILKLNCNNESTSVVYYLQRIFILNAQYVEIMFTQLLKNHLLQYQKESKFKKNLQVNLNGMTNENNLKIISEFATHKQNDDIAIIHLEKTNFDEIVEDELVLRKQFSDKVIEICDIDLIMETIFNCKEGHIQQAIQTVEKCLETYGLDNVFLTFNGGKDCTVLLHLINIVRKILYPEHQKPLFCLYVRDNDTFPEQDKFVAQCQIYYNLDILSLCLGMKEALAELLHRKPNLKACFLGTRRTDPYSGNLATFQMTDSSWPAVMRVNPLLEWHYSDIWNYLLFYKVPYCKLYDQGYTSLGSASSTVRNPFLLHHSIRLGKEIYLPAYKLLNEAEERSGRQNKVKQ